VINCAFKQRFALIRQIVPAELVVIGAEVVIEGVVVMNEVAELDDVVDPWLGSTAFLDSGEVVVELEAVNSVLEVTSDVEELVEDKEIVVVVTRTGLIETLGLDVVDKYNAVVKVDVLVVVAWIGLFDIEELTNKDAVSDDTNKSLEVVLVVVDMLEPLELVVL
jgi:hypothetical protein